MQVCCIYQGQACILLIESSWIFGTKTWRKTKKVSVLHFLVQGSCHTHDFASQSKGFRHLWFKEIKRVELQSNSCETSKFQVFNHYIVIYHILYHNITMSITHYSTGRPTPLGLYPWSSLRICRWETLQKGPIPDAHMPDMPDVWPQQQVCLGTQRTPDVFFSILIHFARLLQWIFTDSSDLNASELFPMLWRQAIVPQAFPTYLGIRGSGKRGQTDLSISGMDNF